MLRPNSDFNIQSGCLELKIFRNNRDFQFQASAQEINTLCGIAHCRPDPPTLLIPAEERGLHVCGVLLDGGGRASTVAVDAIEKKGSAHSDQARQHEPSLSRRREL